MFTEDKVGHGGGGRQANKAGSHATQRIPWRSPDGVQDSRIPSVGPPRAGPVLPVAETRGRKGKQPDGMFWHVQGAPNVLATRCAVWERLFAPYRTARKTRLNDQGREFP